MAIGDPEDMAVRMASVLPARWFPDLSNAPVLLGLLTGFGTAWSFCFNLLAYAKLQARIATATGVFLDMAAADFFGLGLKRRNEEADDAFRGRIGSCLLQEMATREAVIAAVARVTTAVTTVFEPMRPADTGGYGGMATPTVGGGFGYGVAGLAYGSLLRPFQFLVDVRRSATAAQLSGAIGYGASGDRSLRGGYGCGAFAYATVALVEDDVRPADIEAAVAAMLPAGTIAWMRVE